MFKLNPKKYQSSKGFSILEVFLATSVSVGLMMAVFAIAESYGERELARANARFYNTITDAMLAELSDISIFDAYDRLAAGQPLEVAFSSDPASPCPNLLRACQVVMPDASIFTIPPARLLNNTFNNTNLSKHDLSLVLIPLSASTGTGKSFEIFVSESEPSPLGFAMATAAEIGARGGSIRYADITTATANSITNGWSLPINGAAAVAPAIARPNLNGTGWYGALPAALNDDEAIVASYDMISRTDSSSDYLFRTKQGTDTQMNTMYSTLYMAQNKIIGADHINTGSMNLNSANFRGPTSITSDFTVNNGDLTVIRTRADGTAESDKRALNIQRNMAWGPGGTNTLSASPQLIVNGNMQTGSLNVGNTLSAQDAVVTNAVTADGIVTDETASAFNVTGTFRDVYSGSISAANSAVSVSSTDPAKGTLTVGRVTGATINAGGKNMALGAAGGSNGGLKTLTTGSLVADDIILDTNVNIERFGTCNQGCD